jgi:hypothetical protein
LSLARFTGDNPAKDNKAFAGGFVISH